MSKKNLISVSEFRSKYFREGSAPTPTTVRHWIETGVLAGRIVNGGLKRTFFIDADAWERSTGDSSVDDFLSTIGDSEAA